MADLRGRMPRKPVKPGQLYLASIQSAWNCFDFYEGKRHFLKSTKGLTKPQVLVLAVHWCDAEVCNGGYWQFFWNSTGLIAPEAMKGFKAIGALREMELLQKAMKKLLRGCPFPTNREMRQGALLCHVGDISKAERAFGEFQKEYFSLRKRNSLESKLDAYVRSHKDDFFVT